MADNLSQKSNKSSEKTKYSNAINRTTSETMRLGEPEKTVNHPTSLISTTPNTRKKTPSFQITSVTVGSRTSNDGGDDSADDLDESHTDDMSDVVDTSRITDIENETPSYSEDTFSKEDVFFNAPTTSLGSAPVIPTSSQYGLAIVSTEAGGNVNTAVTCANTASNDASVNVTDSGNVINLGGSVKPHETEMRDVHSHHAGRNERFKVVKIESTEPFKRGRWLCMDYLDHTMVQQQPSQQAVINVVRTNDSGDNTTVGSVQYVGPDSGVVLTDGPMTLQSLDEQIITVDPSQLKPSAVTMQEQHQAMVAAQHAPAMTGLTAGQNMASHGNFPSVSPGQTLQHVQQSVQVPQQHMAVTSQHQGMQQQTLQQGGIPQSLPQGMQQVVAQQQMHQQQQNQQVNQQQNLQGQSQSISAAQQVLQQQHHAQSMSQVPLQQPMAPGVPQQPQSVAQHQSLPPQQIQQVMAAANLQQMQQQQQLQQMSQQQQTFSSQQPPQQQQQLPQGVGPQQVSSQTLPQGMVPTQQPQSQHITSQAGQSQGQYYNIAPSAVSQQVGGVPISQAGIQILSQQPQTSMSAQTQTMQTSTPNQMPPGIVTSQPQVATSLPMQAMPHHQMQQGGGSIVTSQNQAMQHLGQSAVPQQLPSQTSQQQHNIQQIQQQQQQYAQQMQQQASQGMQQPQQMMQQTMPQQAMQQTQQGIPQTMQQPQQGIPQTMQQAQQGIPQPMQQAPQGIPQAMQQPQKAMQQPQQVMPQPLQQPQQAMSQVLQQPQQAMPQVMQQPQQTMQQVMQQPQQTIPQQVMHQQQTMQQQTLQQQQQTLQQQKIQPQQAMQSQPVMQPPQAMQQMHHPTNLQNIQQIHMANVPNIAQGQSIQNSSSMAAMVQSQGMMPTSQGQGLIAGHQITVTGAPQVPQGQQVAPQMVPVSSAVNVNISGTSMAQTFSHMPGSQASIQTFPAQGTTTVPSRTVPSGVGVGSVNMGMEGMVDQGAGLGTVNAVGGDPSVTLLESLVEVTTNPEEIQQGAITTGEDAESASGTSAVAIDNKIEQAMDLVKSHLMFAVREEVEVLKEKIAELMDRINQLELENTILKAHASQETLAQLGGSTTQQGNKNQQPQQPPNGSVS